ncbi:hypothetical protein A1D29_10470 [Pasteurellaceae bacterium Orientalotternb1]|nr:hypothetical protein A1D29_10470 [Pasteurellaceae bacterium Orientalotternb1]
MAKVEMIDRNNPEEFLKCCYVFVTQTKNNPLVVAKAIEQGIHHFEVNRENGMVNMKAVLTTEIEKATKN